MSIQAAILGTNTGLVLRPYQHNLFGACWVCGNEDGLEEHHIVPVSYGGYASPLVELCGSCHTNVHNLSYYRALFNGQLVGEKRIVEVAKFAYLWRRPLSQCSPALSCSKALYLGSVIYNARNLVKGAENKTAKFSTEFSGETSRKLKVLAKSHGLTQEDMVHAAINLLYEQRIGSLKDGGTGDRGKTVRLKSDKDRTNDKQGKGGR